MADSITNKVMTTKDAVKKFVKDGDNVSIASFVYGTPYALIHEIIRQRKRDLTIWSQSGVEEIELLIGGGCVKRVVTAYNFRTSESSEFERALKAGRLEVEDCSNFTVLAMMWGGAMGYSFVPVLPAIKYTDIYRIRTFLGDKKFKTIKCPFTGKEVVVVPGVNPDVAIVHVQRADVYGNAQCWGSIANQKWASLACKKIIVTAEEIVDHEVIQSSPHFTIIPSFRTNAVIQESWGAHSAELVGYYNADWNFKILFLEMNKTSEGLQEFLDEWVYDLNDRTEYIQHYIERFGIHKLNALRIGKYYSAPVNYGSPVSARLPPGEMERLEHVLEARGELYGG